MSYQLLYSRKLLFHCHGWQSFMTQDLGRSARKTVYSLIMHLRTYRYLLLYISTHMHNYILHTYDAFTHVIHSYTYEHT